jgi:hypothetical protein
MRSGTSPRGGIGSVKSKLKLSHGLSCGEFGEAGGGVLAGEIAGGDLLDAGSGEEGDGDGGEERCDEESEDEGGAGRGTWSAEGEWRKYRRQPANGANGRE